MTLNKRCVCSGIRSCLKCESIKSNDNQNNKYIDYYFCDECGDKAFLPQFRDHFNHNINGLVRDKDYKQINGIFLKKDVIDINYESDLVKKIDSIEWIDSQSGRKKQDFGPKVNFKRKKVNCRQFLGLPHFDKQLFQEISQQIKGTELLKDFIAVEVCHLEYNPLNGSAIDPHFDDFWVWGPRLVTVNLLSDTVLNLVLPQELQFDCQLNPRIRVPLPQRSLIILFSDSRYKYHHSIERQDILSRRIAVTYRELSEQFLPNGCDYEKLGKQILNCSLNSL